MACTTTSDRIDCEVEWSLLQLPRTSKLAVDQIGVALDAVGQEEAVQPVWRELPTAVTFRPGADLRAALWTDEFLLLPEQERYSYQPGEADRFEIAARRHFDLTTWVTAIDIKKCQLSAPWAKLGTVELRFPCGPAQGALVFIEGKPQTQLEGSSAPKVIERAGELHVFTSARGLNEFGDPYAVWQVQRVTATGEVQSETVQAGPECSALRLHHNSNYARLEIGCRVTEPTASKPTWRTHALEWSPTEHGYRVLSPDS